MNATEYRKWCRRFDNHRVNTLPKSLVYGLLSEAGEVAGEFEKADRVGHELNLAKVKEELGDVLWNVARIADELGFTLDEIMEDNINKLIARYTERGIPMRHEFDPSYSGMVCQRMVIRDGGGDVCGEPADSEVHTR